MMDVHSVIGGAGYVGKRTRRRYCSFTDGHRTALLEASMKARVQKYPPRCLGLRGHGGSVLPLTWVFH